jgi:L-galactono-1,4-lactone dehydrogenase
MNLVDFDKVLKVDAAARMVTVQPGIKVGDLCEYLIAEHGLTLENLASIAEQQVGGFVSVGAHGTGARLPSVDMQVESMKLATANPALGTLTLSRASNPALFDLARVGLGALGVLVEVTLRCVPAHDLLEHTYAVSRSFIKENHARLLREHRHVRFMWVPYTDTVVVVTNDPVPQELVKAAPSPHAAAGEVPGANGPGTGGGVGLGGSLQQQRRRLASMYDMGKLKGMPPVGNCATGHHARKHTELEATAPMRQLLSQHPSTPMEETAESLAPLGFSELRDRLLALGPLDVGWVKQVNGAEAEFWRRSESFRIGRNVDLLQFDCGGEQWVSEVAFPAGSLEQPTGADLGFMEAVLKLIEDEGIPAPAPIEQRWSSDSGSAMSPSHATPAQRRRLLAAPNLSDTFHSWVGIIMYLPTEDPAVRRSITEAFLSYKKKCASLLWDKYDAQEHWAKIEVPGKEVRDYDDEEGDRDGESGGKKEKKKEWGEGIDQKELAVVQRRLQRRYPLDAFVRARRELDPLGILSNAHVDTLMPLGVVGD